MNRRRRTGFTLVEVLTVIAISTVIMGIAVGLLHSLMRTRRAAERQFGYRATIARLAEGFRHDVHAAARLDLTSKRRDGGEAAFLCQLALGADGLVEYESTPGEVIRMRRMRDQVLSRETFTLPPGTMVSIDRPGGENQGIVSLVVAPAAEQSIGPVIHALQIDATLARDHRFERSPRESVP